MTISAALSDDVKEPLNHVMIPQVNTDNFISGCVKQKLYNGCLNAINLHSIGIITN